MQKSVIFFKQSLPEKVVTLLVSIANEAFNNREGQITGIRESFIVCLLVVMRICMAVCN